MTDEKHFKYERKVIHDDGLADMLEWLDTALDHPKEEEELRTTIAILEARLKEVEAERDRLQRLVATEGPEFEAMVERAAIAACNHDPSLKRWEDFGERSVRNPDEWWVSPDIGRNWWRGIARAALRAALGGRK